MTYAGVTYDVRRVAYAGVTYGVCGHMPYLRGPLLLQNRVALTECGAGASYSVSACTFVLVKQVK